MHTEPYLNHTNSLFHIFVSDANTALNPLILKQNEIKYIINCTVDVCSLFQTTLDNFFDNCLTNGINHKLIFQSQSEEEAKNIINRIKREISDCDYEAEYLNIPLVDQPSQDILQYTKKVIDFIEMAKQQKGNVLIHCRKGRSRSISILCLYLLSLKQNSLNDILSSLRNQNQSIQPNSGFMKQLQQYEESLK